MKNMETKGINLRRIGFIAIVLILAVIGIATLNVRADFEPNDDFEHVETITEGIYTGSLNWTDENDFYNITVSAGQTINVKVTPESSLAANLHLYDEYRERKASDFHTGEGEISSVSWTTNSARPSYVYYIHVERYEGAGNYTMDISLIHQNDCNGGDAGDRIETANTISVGTCTGFLGNDDNNDYYKITLNAGQTINVELTPESSLAASLYLYDEDRVKRAYDFHVRKGEISRVSWKTDSTQVCFIHVEKYEGSGNYTMEVSVGGIVTPTPTPAPITPTPTPGFEAILAIAELLAVAHLFKKGGGKYE